jgi:hypothetical protein
VKSEAKPGLDELAVTRAHPLPAPLTVAKKVCDVEEPAGKSRNCLDRLTAGGIGGTPGIVVANTSVNKSRRNDTAGAG